MTGVEIFIHLSGTPLVIMYAGHAFMCNAGTTQTHVFWACACMLGCTLCAHMSVIRAFVCVASTCSIMHVYASYMHAPCVAVCPIHGCTPHLCKCMKTCVSVCVSVHIMQSQEMTAVKGWELLLLKSLQLEIGVRTLYYLAAKRNVVLSSNTCVLVDFIHKFYSSCTLP